jgi:hypothetical protein
MWPCAMQDYPVAAAIFQERLEKARRYGNQTSVRITLGRLAEIQIMCDSFQHSPRVHGLV